MLVGWVLAGCPGEITSGSDASLPPDGTIEPGNGLTVTFRALEGLPVMIGTTRLDRVRLFATTVRVNGDSGDASTTRVDYKLEWDAMKSPPSIQFDEAPIGLYSSVELQIEEESGSNGWDAFELEGEAVKDGEEHDFDIESHESVISVNLPVETMLAPGSSASIEITVDLAALVANIDWEQVGIDDDTLTIDDDDAAEITSIRAQLQNAFTDTAPR